MIQKQRLRKQLLQQRKSLTQQEWQSLSQQICQQLENNSLYCEAKTILSYFSFRQEPDLSGLWQDNQKKWGFPRCVSNSLHWYYWQPGESLENNQYNIPEPLTTASVVKPEDVDLILVPTVACDKHGYRLGYGGGYYDRFLGNPDWQNIPTVGITFEFAYLTSLPTESWDIKLNFICTETGFSL